MVISKSLTRYLNFAWGTLSNAVVRVANVRPQHVETVIQHQVAVQTFFEGGCCVFGVVVLQFLPCEGHVLRIGDGGT